MSLKPYVEITGSGPPLVLLHGWGLHGGIWATVIEQLARHFSVHNVDLPGFGHSEIHADEYTLDYLVEAVESILPEPGQNGACFLLGWSLGGLVATALALKSPDKIGKLITVASNPSFVANDDWRFGVQAKILDAFIDSLAQDYENTLLRFLSLQTMGSATQKADIKRLKETVFIHGTPSHKALIGGLTILHDINLVPRLSQLTMPVLRLYGRLDSLVPVRVTNDVAKYLPQSQAIIYKKAAHAPFLSSADQFVGDVLNFLTPQVRQKETIN